MWKADVNRTRKEESYCKGESIKQTKANDVSVCHIGGGKRLRYWSEITPMKNWKIYANMSEVSESECEGMKNAVDKIMK